jgi:hypothetical protein
MSKKVWKQEDGGIICNIIALYFFTFRRYKWYDKAVAIRQTSLCIGTNGLNNSLHKIYSN